MLSDCKAFSLAESAVFEGEVHVVEHNIEQLCNVVSEEMVRCVFNLVDSIVDGFQDRNIWMLTGTQSPFCTVPCFCCWSFCLVCIWNVLKYGFQFS